MKTETLKENVLDKERNNLEENQKKNLQEVHSKKEEEKEQVLEEDREILFSQEESETIDFQENAILEDDEQEAENHIKEQEEQLDNKEKKTDDLQKLEQTLYKNCMEMDALAKDLSEKANRMVEVEEEIQYKLEWDTTSLMMLATSYALSKQVKGPKALIASLLTGYFALKLGSSLFHRVPEVHFVKHYEDYSEEIKKAQASLNDLEKLFQKGLKEIEELQKEFEEEFHDLLFEDNEYKKGYDTICLLKDDFLKHEELLSQEASSLDESMDITKEKVYFLKQ